MEAAIDVATGGPTISRRPVPFARCFIRKALATSLFLHAGLVAAWLLTPGAPVDIPSQPFAIEIIMAAAPPQPEPAQDKPPETKPVSSQTEREIKPRTVADMPLPEPVAKVAEAKTKNALERKRKPVVQPPAPALDLASNKREGADERIVQPQFNAAYLRNPQPDERISRVQFY